MRPSGFALILLGVCGLIAGAVDYRRSHRTVRLGSFSATIQERKTNVVPPLLGGIALCAGLALVEAGRQSRD
jgi:hypothetical protein